MFSSKSSSKAKSSSKSSGSDSDDPDIEMLLRDLSDSESDSDNEMPLTSKSDFISTVSKKELQQFRRRKQVRFKEKRKKGKVKGKIPKAETIFQPQRALKGRIGELASKFQSRQRGSKPVDFNKMFNSSFPAFDSMAGGNLLQQKAFSSPSQVVSEMKKMEEKSEKAVLTLRRKNNNGLKRLLKKKRRKSLPVSFRKAIVQQLKGLESGEIDDIDNDLLAQTMLKSTRFQVPRDIVKSTRKLARREKQPFKVESIGLSNAEIGGFMDDIGFVKSKSKKTEEEKDPDFTL